MSLPSLELKLTSLQPPEAGELVRTNPTDPVDKHLLIFPGEPAEMAVRLDNLENNALQWRLEVTGDFPVDWSLWQQDTEESIAPQQRVNKTLSFRIPKDFFEGQSSLNQQKPQLKLDYRTQVSVYGQWDGQEKSQLIGYRVFNLFVRPPSSYLDFLPAFYGETDFVQRFLSIFEQAFDPTIQTMDTLWAYLDPLTSPQALLPFLAHWVAFPLDKRWDIKQQRFLIRHAIEMYRWQGTRRGLRRYLHLYTGLALDEDLPESEKQISIEEIFSQGFIMGKTAIGQDSLLGGGRPYHFIVHLRPRENQQVDEQLVKDLIEQEKPAFCTYDLYIHNDSNR